MDNDNLNVSHLAWCGLIALHTARRDGIVTSPAQDNLFLTRWLATAEKHRRFPRTLASDISWLLKEGREKGLRADLHGKLDYLWRAGNGNLQGQNDLFRLQHALHAVKLTGWIYMVLAESEWSGRRQLRLSTSVSGIYLNRHALDAGFDGHGRQRIPLPARITGELPALDKLLQRSGWRREAARGADDHLHHLLADGFSAE
ncbi:DUF2913 family protein [Pantoea dispersa]|uniref:DUF2913 family protein n=1 Tax=Pantoea dispersa TaxID=59814 RepID=UPI000FDCC9D5|nr:DUF2913 family protein [Pantoea dispersa]MCT6592711.1 DUF2913 family protein [Pantoea dispersa]MCW0323728.1 hypothetical protein [Pantoea dispersa]MCW0328464.1 hypothetical protein [Pantoea dispersa]MCW0434889.1 hypothetical protein [Pantoea dispersa]RVU72013.1 DUF2913 family protein [Pantoea dispersa]